MRNATERRSPSLSSNDTTERTKFRAFATDPIESFTLEFDGDIDESTFFQPSQGIQGRAVLILRNSAAISAINVQVQAIVSGGISYAIFGCNQSAKRSQPLPFACHRYLFRDKIALYPRNTAQTQNYNDSPLSAGRYSWPFSFRIPPVSYMPPTYRGKLGTVRYEVVVTLERGADTKLGMFSDARKGQKITVKKELAVRSIMTRQARRAYGTPVFQTFGMLAGSITARKVSVSDVSQTLNPVSLNVELAVKLPRAGFVFGEDIPFTVDILNTSKSFVQISNICLEERVTVIYNDRSRMGPVTTIRVPFPFNELIGPSAINQTRSFRLKLPPQEPQVAQVRGVIDDNPILGRTMTLGRGRRGSLGQPSIFAASECASSNQPQSSRIGLNASFQSQPLKVTHFLTFRVKCVSPSSAIYSSKAHKIEIPIMLSTCRREDSLLLRESETAWLVEDAEREEEDRQLRREGITRRSSIDTLPGYEPGDSVIALESSGGFDPVPGDEPASGERPPLYRWEQSEYQFPGFSESNDSPSIYPEDSDPTLSESAIPTIVADEHIPLNPFVDNNPPSFETIMMGTNGRSMTLRSIMRRRSNTSVRPVLAPFRSLECHSNNTGISRDIELARTTQYSDVQQEHSPPINHDFSIDAPGEAGLVQTVSNFPRQQMEGDNNVIVQSENTEPISNYQGRKQFRGGNILQKIIDVLAGTRKMRRSNIPRGPQELLYI